MADKELLELAAKAAGLRLEWQRDILRASDDGCVWEIWNPLESDGDALRLAVNLRINVCFSQPEEESSEQYSWTVWREREFDEGGDPASATRRAIVRSAAAIGATHD